MKLWYCVSQYRSNNSFIYLNDFYIISRLFKLLHAHITCSIYSTRILLPNFAIWNVLISNMMFAFCFQINILLSEMEKKTWSAENMKKPKNIFGVQLLLGCSPTITLPFCFAIPVLYKQWSIDTMINASLFYCLGSLQTSRGVSLLATSSGLTNHGSSNTTMSVGRQTYHLELHGPTCLPFVAPHTAFSGLINFNPLLTALLMARQIWWHIET